MQSISPTHLLISSSSCTSSPTMSTLGGMEANRLPMNPTHRRKDSGEIDVFEAARYFSGWPEPRRYFGQAHGRKSLDICMKSSFPSQGYNMVDENHMIVQENKMKKKKKSKLPSSPGGKLASFLNSLFSQASSKKKPKSSTSHSVKDEEEISPGGRRRRRSSISHFRGFVIGKSKSFYSSSNSDFRTPPTILSQPPSTQTYYERKDMKGYLEESRSSNLLSKFSEQAMPMSSFLQNNEVASNVDHREYRKHKLTGEFSCLGKEIRSMYGKVLEKKGMDIEGDRAWAREKKSQKSFARVLDIGVDDGGDSDSSSDLFDLPNFVLGHVYSNGLPVYETTHLENLNRSRGLL